MENGLQCLLLSNDDKAVRVLRRVLSEMDIAIEHCTETDQAVRKLTRQRFESIIVDCADADVAYPVLKSAKSSPANQRAILVAILDSSPDSQSAQKRAFESGTHFVLFKPVSLERTRASFRAVRALMKRERRRHVRVPIETAVELDIGQTQIKTTSADLGENGMAIKIKDRKLPGSLKLAFTLPGDGSAIQCRGEVAWEGKQIVGIRFCNLLSETREQLKSWITRQLAGTDADEPSVSCKLTDLSLRACYLQTESPFPVRTRLRLFMKVSQHELQVEGLVRVMHAGSGMGVEFVQNTSEQMAKVEKFIQTLMKTEGAIPDLQVKPDTIDNSAAALSSSQDPTHLADPLLSLFVTKADASEEMFQEELRKQRGVPEEAGVPA